MWQLGTTIQALRGSLKVYKNTGKTTYWFKSHSNIEDFWTDKDLIIKSTQKVFDQMSNKDIIRYFRTCWAKPILIHNQGRVKYFMDIVVVNVEFEPKIMVNYIKKVEEKNNE